MAADTPVKVVQLRLPMDTYEIAKRMARDAAVSCVGSKIRQDIVEHYAKADRRRRANMNTETEGTRNETE